MGRIKPVSYIQPMSKGRSSPQLIRFNDQCEYVVKFKNNPQGNWVVAYEYLVNSLATLLHLPVPEFKIVRIRSKFIKEYKELKGKEFKSGNQFASKYMKDTVLFSDLPKLLSKDQVVNRDQAAGMIVFDHWVSNSDRNIKNLLFKPEAGRKDKYTFWMIDQANCFNITTTNPERKFLPLKVRNKEVYRWCNTLVDHKKQLTSFRDRILDIKNEKIHELIYAMPEDWDLSDRKKEELYNHIKYAKRALPKIVDKYIKRFF